MAIKEFGHIAFNCRNQKKSVEFYRDKLGFKEKFTFYFSDYIDMVNKGVYKIPAAIVKKLEKKKDEPWLTYLECGDGRFIELFNPIGAFIPHPALPVHYNYQHFALMVDDIYKTKEEFIAKGIKIDIDISFGPEFTYQMWIHDPDGNAIEIMQYTDKSFQLVGRE